MSFETKNRLDKLDKMLEFRSELDKTEIEESLLSLKFIASIEAIMEQKNINQTKLATILNSSKSYVSQLFSGYKMVNIKTLSKLQKELNISFRIEAIDNKKFELQPIADNKKSRQNLPKYKSFTSTKEHPLVSHNK